MRLAYSRGWIAQIAFDPEDGMPPRVVAYCPPCAASEFGYRPEAAEGYACAWEPLPGQVIDIDDVQGTPPPGRRSLTRLLRATLGKYSAGWPWADCGPLGLQGATRATGGNYSSRDRP